MWWLQCADDAANAAVSGQMGVQRLFHQLAKLTCLHQHGSKVANNKPIVAFCRLAVKYDKNKRCVLVGFVKTKPGTGGNRWLPGTDAALSALIVPLRALINELSSARDVGSCRAV